MCRGRGLCFPHPPPLTPQGPGVGTKTPVQAHGVVVARESRPLLCGPLDVQSRHGWRVLNWGQLVVLVLPLHPQGMLCTQCKPLDSYPPLGTSTLQWAVLPVPPFCVHHPMPPPPPQWPSLGSRALCPSPRPTPSAPPCRRTGLVWHSLCLPCPSPMHRSKMCPVRSRSGAVMVHLQPPPAHPVLPSGCPHGLAAPLQPPPPLEPWAMLPLRSRWHLAGRQEGAPCSRLVPLASSTPRTDWHPRPQSRTGGWDSPPALQPYPFWALLAAHWSPTPSRHDPSTSLRWLPVLPSMVAAAEPSAVEPQVAALAGVQCRPWLSATSTA